ncbi:MAG: 4-hydroxy-3-methylbut-2-enyl diphosphate reductase, partial [Defluviitaleaceae bacterium]|nr:4-hydroxy-3-methylbut-2-enyl diphosphate reductase [Defluviitaleaceae bacterium]
MVKTMKESGFCHGVKAAVHKADAQTENVKRGKSVYLYGDLVNNRHVMARYKQNGFIVAESAEDVSVGASVIIRAHGVGKKVYEALAAKNAEIIDCTCVKVKSIHKIVEEKSSQGKRIIIVGKSGHPEVLGIFGWCEDYVIHRLKRKHPEIANSERAYTQSFVVETESELQAALSQITDTEKICVVAQTTCKKAWWERAVEIIKSKHPTAEIFDTLCDVIAKRIPIAVELAKQSDVMVVVGDKKSANSLELNEACKAACKCVYFVSSLEELIGMEFSNAGEIGMVGSASAPSETMDNIADFLRFTDFQERVKTEIETASEKYLDDWLSNSTGQKFINDAIRDLRYQNQGGKRIRGTMIKLGEKIASNDTSNISAPVALAYELFQTAILIHDDIIDKSHTRRGKTTIHASESDPHFGTSRAICIGDYGLFLANKILSESGLPAETLVKVFQLFSAIQLKTLEGEIMDVSMPYHPINLEENYDEYTQVVRSIYEYKTAWYTLAGPIMLGAICGGADEKLINLLRDIMLPLGMAFQIKDDLLGIYESDEVLGKPALSDIAEKKQTILYGYAYTNATHQQREELNKSYGNPKANEDDLTTVRRIFTATGAKQHANDQINSLSLSALNLIETIDENHRPLLRGLVHYLTTRRY